MRYIIIFLFLFGLDISVISQTAFTKGIKRQLAEANYNFEYENYYLAIPLYKEIYFQDSLNKEINYKLGVCIFKVQEDKTEALKYLERAKDKYIDAYIYLSRIYHLQGLFDRALLTYRFYKEQVVPKGFTDEEVEYYESQSLVARELISTPVNVRISNIGNTINSRYDDYVPIISSDGNTLYFTSRREGSTGNCLDPLNKYYEDIYVSYRKHGQWSLARNIGEPINTYLHDACVGLSLDATKMFLYRTSEDLQGGDIYISEWNDTLNAWQSPVKFTSKVNSAKSLESSLTMSPDENVIYFSSDRKGGYGGKDIYKVVKLPNGEWSSAQNLGPVINTKYDEDAPFIYADGKTLYFSSKGHRNMGGYDIFWSTLDDTGQWSLPVNIGYPINTVNDDIFFVLTAAGDTAYYSSHREDSFGEMDIYLIELLDKISRGIIIKGHVFAKDSIPRPLKAKITLLDYHTRQLCGLYRTNAITGKYIMVLRPDIKYKIIIEHKNFYIYTEEFSYNKNFINKEVIKDFYLESKIKLDRNKEKDSKNIKEDKEEINGNNKLK